MPDGMGPPCIARRRVDQRISYSPWSRKKEYCRSHQPRTIPHHQTRGSPLIVDGKVYLGDEDGDVVVLRHGREFEELGEYNMGAAVYTTPVALDGVLYILSRNRLYALETTGSP